MSNRATARPENRIPAQAIHAGMIPVGMNGAGTDDAQSLLQLGIMYSIGASVPADMVSAHKWFNIAASRGSAEAARLRREIADEMSEAEIAAAQRAARDWITRH